MDIGMTEPRHYGEHPNCQPCQEFNEDIAQDAAESGQQYSDAWMNDVGGCGDIGFEEGA